MYNCHEDKCYHYCCEYCYTTVHALMQEWPWPPFLSQCLLWWGKLYRFWRLWTLLRKKRHGPWAPASGRSFGTSPCQPSGMGCFMASSWQMRWAYCDAFDCLFSSDIIQLKVHGNTNSLLPAMSLLQHKLIISVLQCLDFGTTLVNSCFQLHLGDHACLLAISF